MSVTTAQLPTVAAFSEPHHPIAYWAALWGFSAKTVREWFRDEIGPGVLRVANRDRRDKRDYTTLAISRTAAARVYEARTLHGSARKTPEVM